MASAMVFGNGPHVGAIAVMVSCILILSGCVSGQSANAVTGTEPGFYECRFNSRPPRLDRQPLEVRFMLPHGFATAFILGPPTAHPATLEISSRGDITLIDYRQDQGVYILTARKDGRAVYSTHWLNRMENTRGGSELGMQLQGRCNRTQATAFLYPDGDPR